MNKWQFTAIMLGFTLNAVIQFVPQTHTYTFKPNSYTYGDQVVSVNTSKQDAVSLSVTVEQK